MAPNLEGAVPSHLPVLPLKSTVVFPRIFIPLSVGRKTSLQLLEELSGIERHIAVPTQLDDPLHLAYYIANHIRLTTEQRQEILELDSSKAKLERLLGHMSHELEVLELGRKIQSQAEEQMGKAQREYFLREQLKAIQRELGELDTEHAELSELRERIEKAGLPLEAKREADREIGRLERIPPASPESSVIRTYLELMVSLPWNVSTGGEVDVKKSPEILDPEQNKDFRDNYLDVPFDLSKVMFITTANSLETIPPALRDRMEVLHLSGYTEEEKVQIAERFLIPKQVSAHGLRDGEITISEEAVRLIIREYTREAGVRNLEREIASLIRRDVAEIAGGKRLKRMDDVKKVRAALGKRRFYDDVAERIDRPGVATGLVWTPTGGEIIFVEATLTPGKGELKLTGQLGEVMKESAAAALSYLKSHASDIGIDPALFDKSDIHVHVPAGAQPKEGPSAGVTVLTAMASILTGRPVRDDVAMTGEITLRGKVLPIGGIKEKVLGAHRAGLRRVLMPSHNEADLDDIPADLRKQMQFVMLESIDQVLREALVSRRPVVLNGGNGLRTTVVARAAGSSRARPAPPSRRGAKGRRPPVA